MTETSDYRAAEAFGIGVAAIVVFGPLMMVIVSLSQQQPVPDIAPLSLPRPEMSIPLLPRATGGLDLGEWAWDVVSGLLFLAIVAAYYLTLGGVALGLLFIVVGIGFAKDVGELARWLARRGADRRVQVVGGVYAFAWAAIVNPWLMDIVIEVLIILTVGGTVFLLSTAGWLWLRDRAGPVATVLGVYPLGTLMLLLPPIAAGLVSPTFAEYMRRATTVLAIWLLDTVLVIGGLNAFLRRTFDLEGLGYIGVWVGIIVVVGWTVGLIVRLLEERDPSIGIGRRPG